MFSSRIFLNRVIHGYKETILKKSSLWLLQFYMTVATYCYYEAQNHALELYRTSLTKCTNQSLKKSFGINISGQAPKQITKTKMLPTAKFQLSIILMLVFSNILHDLIHYYKAEDLCE